MRTLQTLKSVTDEKRVPTILIDNWIRSQKNGKYIRRNDS